MKINDLKWYAATALFAATSWTHAFALDSGWVNQKLAEFESNPREFIHNSKNTMKYDPDTLQPIQMKPKFSKESIESLDFILEKDREEHSAKSYRKTGRGPIRNNDQAENLVDELRFFRLQEMEQEGMMSAQVSVAPWSSDYWAISLGSLARRYADPGFPNSSNWQTNINYISTTRSSSVDQLSPSEKYDLLVGDSHQTLTRAMIDAGVPYFKSYGKVEPWMGICHGWAPASFMIARPEHAIEVTAANGQTKIQFYPSDIKALSSLLWANGAPKTRFIGGRCDEKHPAEDANGHILNPDCFDTNPGTWHTAIVNQIGVSKRSFVIDATYDYEVWNQPVYSYEYVYFNPSTLQYVNNLNDATVSRSSFHNDRFTKYRSSNTAYMAGIVMKLTYVAETTPSHNLSDSETFDRRISVNYFYDLELDDQYRIIGGEWYQRQHPDFMWLPEPNARATSIGDLYIESSHSAAWDPQDPLPASWTHAAQEGSKRSQPLAAIVDALVTHSKLHQ